MISVYRRINRCLSKLLRLITTTPDPLTQIHSDFLAKVSPVGEGELKTSIRNRTIFVELSNVSKKNAISGSIMRQLARFVDELCFGSLFKDCNFLIFSGDPAGGTFCSGADLTLARDVLTTADDGMQMCLFMSDALNRIHTSHVISMAYLNGPAIGGGSELATAFDYRSSSSLSYIQFIHTQLGLIPGWGGCNRLLNLIGRRKTLAALSSGRRISCKEGLEIGLIDYSHESLVQATVQLHSTVTKEGQNVKSPGAVMGVKKLIGCLDAVNSDQIELEMNAFASRWRSEDHIKSLSEAPKVTPK